MGGNAGAQISLFSYGTLRQADVQMATFGRLLDGRPDALAGYSLSPFPIGDPDVVAVSGSAVHTIAGPTGNADDRVEGILFSITPEELAAADLYEVDGIDRIEAMLVSGQRAFVYVDGRGR